MTIVTRKLNGPLPEVALPKRRNSPDTPVPFSPLSIRDDMMRDLSRLLEQQEFGSLDEVNAFMEKEVKGKPLRHVQPTTDRERAEDLVVTARLERTTSKLRAQVAKALKLDADCVSAHLLLAEVAESSAKSLAHCRDSIAAGDRVLAEQLGNEGASIWHHPVGRQYLSARRVFAELLWQTGDRQLALDEARTILRLNAGDNQGVRYVLLEWLMRAGSVAEIDALLAAYDDGTAAWMFTTALHRYRTLGPVTAAAKALRTAMRENPYVVPMLIGETPLADELPDTFGMGDPDEATLYLHESISSWYDAAGSMEWLEQVFHATPAGPIGRRKHSGNHT
ncbi:hypothetical protein [Gemmatimonas sp.]|uniref:hypothetical protein n=1 Tax=Gemmatimonas sp. TaxID=1962908 RepID=UPI0035685B88